MKFLLFTDFHHAPGLFMGGDKKDLSLFQRLALKPKEPRVIVAY